MPLKDTSKNFSFRGSHISFIKEVFIDETTIAETATAT
jgi:hypothetical protein